MYYIWKLVYMIYWFLFYCYEGIYKSKLVNLSSMNLFAFIHPAKIVFTFRFNMDHFEKPYFKEMIG